MKKDVKEILNERYIRKEEFLNSLGNLSKEEKTKSICDYFGFEHQADVASEEMGELIQAINKFKRYNMKRNTIPFERALEETNKIINRTKGKASTISRGVSRKSRQSGKDYTIILSNIHEEIADVLICMDNLMYLFDCKEEVENIKNKKIDRSVHRILDEIPDFYFKNATLEDNFRKLYPYLTLEIFDDLNDDSSIISSYLEKQKLSYIFIDESHKINDTYIQIETNEGYIKFDWKRPYEYCIMTGCFEKYIDSYNEAKSQPNGKQEAKYLKILYDRIRQDILNKAKESIKNNTLDIYIRYNGIETILF